MTERICKSLLIVLFTILLFTGCSKQEVLPKEETVKEEPVSEVKEETVMKLIINETEIPVTWEDNESVSALKEKAEEGITAELSMYGGFEQVGSLGFSLPRNDVQIVTESGDIMLYSGNSIVLFYGSNSWSYTRLGRMEISAEEARDLLGNGDVTVTIKAE
ncbi:MAG: hypothetical protein IIZ33_02380 [Erysipelotrichaceae bacterium]|nr:hypothetical protein [Erysipelotrichaceae bacterium]